jgi:choline dehydrogenase-like flavoprotein
VVNNAVCYDLPDRTLQRWNDTDGLDAGIDPTGLGESFARLREWLPVYSQDENKRLQAGGTKMAEGIHELGLDGNGAVVDANIKDCIGSGYCSIGCAYGKMLSALDNILPRAQHEFGDGLRIYSECLAEHIATKGGRATEVVCRLSDGRRLRVAANTVLVSGGALASSLLLQRSGIGGKLAGTGLPFNVGAPLTADFEEVLNSYDGLQITHGYRPPGEDQLILESWFNPVGTQALMMPGWFRDHFENMRRYAHLNCIGVVVGSQRNGTVRAKRGLGMNLRYNPTDADLGLMIKGTKLAARIHFASGALRVMPMNVPVAFVQVDRRGERARRDRPRQHGHRPPYLASPGRQTRSAGIRRRGSSTSAFGIHGIENVYVCDASVFPSSVTVNPQLTVMALADYASAGIE